MNAVIAAQRGRLDDCLRWVKSIKSQTIADDIVIGIAIFGYDEFELLANKLSDYKNVCLAPVHYHPGPFPEAWLKNIIIKRLFGTDVTKICATNIDIVYSTDFFEKVFAKTDDRTLVQALRLDVSRRLHNETPVLRDCMVRGFSSILSRDTNTPIPITACGDCQSMTVANWEKLSGYNEKMVGWGVLDNDLTTRALMAGLSVNIVGYEECVHVHQDHPRDVVSAGIQEYMNRYHMVTGINAGQFRANETWGGIDG